MSIHRCPTCHVQHSTPKAWRAIRVIVMVVMFGVIEVLAALALDGWLSIGLWGIAAWNATLLTMLIVGLAIAAADKAGDPAKTKEASA